MNIKVDYWLRENGNSRIMHTVLTEPEIIELLHQKFKNGDLSCPIGFDRETVSVEFIIDSVTV